MYVKGIGTKVMFIWNSGNFYEKEGFKAAVSNKTSRNNMC
jgi:hypothetical protein